MTGQSEEEMKDKVGEINLLNREKRISPPTARMSKASTTMINNSRKNSENYPTSEGKEKDEPESRMSTQRMRSSTMTQEFRGAMFTQTNNQQSMIESKQADNSVS